MAITWQDVSEIDAGLAYRGRISLNALRPSMFIPPYDKFIDLLQKGTNQPETLIQKVGLDAFQNCLEAEERINGLGDLADWIVLLEEKQIEYQIANQLEKQIKRARTGEGIEWDKLKGMVNQIEIYQNSDFVPLSEVESKEVPFILTGWEAIDEHLGGIPEVGIVLVAGPPKVGKTTFQTKFVSNFVRQHPDKRVAVFSIEMILSELASRFREVDQLTKEEEARILLDETPVSPEEIISKAATIENLGLITVDFIDLMILDSEVNEQVMTHIYKVLMMGAKKLHIPVMILAQLSGNYQGGIPRPHHIRYSRLAEALSWMTLMLYNPATSYHKKDDVDDEVLPPHVKGAYVVCWLVRGGFRKHLEESPGAILVPFRGDKGWGRKGRWYSLRKLV